MKRLRKENINVPELSAKIFRERWKGCPHWVDYERFKFLASRFKKGKYLDVGCFNSPMPHELANEYPNAEVHAIDHSWDVVSKMKHIFPNVKYFVGDVKKLPYPNGHFDYVVAAELIEHMEDPKAMIVECMRVLGRGGILAISTPKDEVNITEEHLWSFTDGDIEDMVGSLGSVDVSVKDWGFPTFVAFVTKL